MSRRILLAGLFLVGCIACLAQKLPTPPDGCEWSDNLIANSDLLTDDLSSFFCSGSGVKMKIVTKSGKKAITVNSTDYTEHDWDSQFFIRTGAPFLEGDQYYVSFSFKADRNETCNTEAHSVPGSYNHWEMLGNINFTSNWQTKQWEGTVTGSQAGSAGLGAIAFDLNHSGEAANNFYFSEVVVRKLLPKGGEGNQTLVINEIQVDNNDLFMDPSYNYGAWIEIYNPGNTEVSLGRYYVSDDLYNLKKFMLPMSIGAVPAHGFKNIWFDHNTKDGSFSSKADAQVRFKLDPEGGTIYLSDPNGKLVQSVNYPPAIPRCSYARMTDGGEEWGTTGMPTPSSSNAGAKFATERLEAPVVNHDGGLFDEGETISFQVSIPEGATLRYTTNGSTPTATYGNKSLTGIFTISKTTIFRFCLVQDDKLPSPVVTRSFIFRNHDYYLPVLSIATKPENLFDNEIGIYVRGTNGIDGRGQDKPCNWNRDWERPVNVEYFVPEQNTDGVATYQAVVNQETGFEICGGWSRGFGEATTDGHHWDAKSSFRLKTSKTFDGLNELPYPVFSEKPYNKYKAWQVRNGGNDSSHRSKDPTLQQAVITSGMDVDCQAYQPCHVFFNGLYLGMMNIRESSNKQYGYSNFGIDTDDMDQFENWGDFKVGDRAAWDELQSRANRLASSQRASDYEAVKELLDVDEFINYMAVQCYFGGSDWLTMSYSNNLKAYRSRSDGGKFRFVMYDVDSALEKTEYWLSMFGYLADGRIGGNIVGELFRSLIKYEDFRRQFLDAMCLVEGSVLEPSRVEDIAQQIADNTRQALSFEGLSPGDMVTEQLRARHKGTVLDNVARHSLYSLSTPYWLELSSNIEAAQLLINGLRVPTGRFDGRMYDYAGKGIHIQAQAPAGYRFMGWKGRSGGTVSTLIDYGSNWDYYDQGSMDAYDWKSVDFTPSSHGWKMSKPAPFGYGNSDSEAGNAKTKLDYGGDSGNKRPTYYLRTKFYVENEPTPDDVIRLNYRVDDGFAFYVNGKYINGFRVSEADARYDFITTDYAGWAPDEGSFEIRPSDVQQGWNTLAVEIHNNSYSSSDMFWDCNLQYVSKGSSTVDVGTSSTLCLSDEVPGAYILEAVYEEIGNKQQRYEAGGVPVRINEVSAGNDIYVNDYRKKNDWVELYNTTDEDIDLSGLYLSDKANKPQKWQISSKVGGTIIPAHGTRIIWCDNLEPVSQLHAPFKLDNADGATVSIQAADGTWADQLTYLSQPRWKTYGRYPDGGNFASLLNVPTIDKSNQYGTIDYNMYDPAEDDESAITLAMAEGWNWTSHNMDGNINVSRFNAFASEIRSQTTSSYLDEERGWMGDISNLNKAEGYKLCMKQAVDITLRGHLYDAAVPVRLKEGWNWMGMPLKNTTALTAALENYSPSVGDQIVGLEGFAFFEDGAWRGSLTKLEPGQAYLFKAVQAQDFAWKDLSTSRRVKQRRYAAAQLEDVAPWRFDIHAYPNVMTVVGRLEADEVDLTAGYNVGAFCGDECRGVAKVDGDVLYMNIHGDGDESICFRLLTADGSLYTSKQQQAMTSMQSLGSLRSPYVLHFGRNDLEDVIQELRPAEGRVVSVQYFNLNGQQVARPSGICIQRTLMSDGTVQVRKVKK